jgi:hypothetical protein
MDGWEGQMAKTAKFDRSKEDSGNIVALEHCNVQIDDQRISTLFYVAGMGLTRDPYMMTTVTNMWINAGRSQFHLPTGKPQVFRGRIGLVMPELDSLVKRLEMVKKDLKGTKFAFKASNGNAAVDVTCPWGNSFRVHAPDEERFGPYRLALPYVMFDVPLKAAPGIARFYAKVFGALTRVEEVEGAPAACVKVGKGQELIFRETKKKLAKFDGHHIQVYVADFSGPHKALEKMGLVSREDNQFQYRFMDIVDPAAKDGKVLFTIEHEVRSLTHPLFARPLVNRDPAQNIGNYVHGWSDRPFMLPA